MIRFGIVGFGLHAVKRMMPGFRLSKNCIVTALSRRDMTKAQESAREYKIQLAFDSGAELVRSAEVDAVFVATPNALHLADVLEAIDAGKPVLCEKPLAINAAEARAMVERARQKNVLFGVAHVFRFDESVRKLREHVAAGAIGKPIFARSEFSFLGAPSHPRRWLYDRRVAGAGPIFDIGVHCIDSLRFILEDEILRVSATAVSDEQSGDVEAAAVLTMEFSRGTIAIAPVSYRAPYRTPLEIIGDNGVVSADDALNVEQPVDIELKRGKELLGRETASNHLAYAFEVDAFADWIEGKAQFPSPGEEGWQNQEVLDAALRSVKTGKAEPVPRVK
jgi:predicted dehydrogenase